jgi:hypothetical protein
MALVGCNSLLGNDAWTLDQDGAADGGQGNDAPFVPQPDGGGRTDSSVFRTDSSVSDSSVQSNDSSVMTFDTSPPPVDSAPVDTGPVDTGITVVLPPSTGTQCLPSQGDSDCPMGETCRIYSSNLGYCDTFTAGHEGGWPCTVDSDCDDTLQCYMGECKVLCPLGMVCTGGCECLYVGNETTGICCPGL